MQIYNYLRPQLVANIKQASVLGMENPTAGGVIGGLGGAGLGAGLLHLLAEDDKKTLMNYLMAAGGGGLVGSGVGVGAGKLKDSFDFVAKEKEQGNADGDAGTAAKQETDKATKELEAAKK